MRSLVFASAMVGLGALAFATSPVPRPAPGFEMVDPSGNHLNLANLKGKVVVLQFLLTTCPHCQAFSQLLNHLQADYGPKGFQALGAAVNEANNQMASEYHSKYAQAFPVAAVPHDTVLTFMGLSVMDRFGLPQIAVIDRKGQIREQSLSDINAAQPLQQEQHLRQLVEKLLAEPAGVSATKAPASGVAAAKKQ